MSLLNREELHHAIFVMDSFLNDREVTKVISTNKLTNKSTITSCPTWNWAEFHYDVYTEPKTKYRPYDFDELVDYCLGESFLEKKTNNLHMCRGIRLWINDSAVGTSEFPEAGIYLFDDGIFSCSKPISPEEFLERFTYIDGSPCGRKIQSKEQINHELKQSLDTTKL